MNELVLLVLITQLMNCEVNAPKAIDAPLFDPAHLKAERSQPIRHRSECGVVPNAPLYHVKGRPAARQESIR